MVCLVDDAVQEWSQISMKDLVDKDYHLYSKYSSEASL